MLTGVHYKCSMFKSTLSKKLQYMLLAKFASPDCAPHGEDTIPYLFHEMWMSNKIHHVPYVISAVPWPLTLQGLLSPFRIFGPGRRRPWPLRNVQKWWQMKAIVCEEMLSIINFIHQICDEISWIHSFWTTLVFVSWWKNSMVEIFCYQKARTVRDHNINWPCRNWKGVQNSFISSISLTFQGKHNMLT